jgi:hypothetical protein
MKYYMETAIVKENEKPLSPCPYCNEVVVGFHLCRKEVCENLKANLDAIREAAKPVQEKIQAIEAVHHWPVNTTVTIEIPLVVLRAFNKAIGGL